MKKLLMALLVLSAALLLVACGNSSDDPTVPDVPSDPTPVLPGPTEPGDPTEPVHQHAPASEWSHDDNEHWHACECGEKLDKAAHAWGEGEVTTVATCQEAGVKTFTCACGATKTEDLGLDANNHGTEKTNTVYANGYLVTTYRKCGAEVSKTPYLTFDHTRREGDETVTTHLEAVLNDDGTYSFELTTPQWGRFVLYYEGQALSSSDVTMLPGTAWDGGAYSGGYPLYHDVAGEGLPLDTTVFLSATGGTYKVTYNPSTNELKLGDTPVPLPEGAHVVGNVNADAELAVWDQADLEIKQLEGNSKEYYVTPNGWRLFIVVDAEGRIAYMAQNMVNGYGGPMSTSYIRHSAYADYTTNPAFPRLSEPYEGQWGMTVDWALGVPAGGFVITAHSAKKDELVNLITGVVLTGGDGDDAAVNTNTHNVDNITITWDAEAKYFVITKEEAPEHQHAPEADWSYDETHHWHECSCGEDLDKAEHNWDNGVEAECQITYTCVDCGQTKVEAVVHEHKHEEKVENGYVWKECECGDATEKVARLTYAHTRSVDGAVVTDHLLAEVDAEGVYTFEFTTPKWGRVVLYYAGEALASDKVVMLPGTAWDGGAYSGNYPLYQDVAGEGLPVDTTVFLSATGGTYKVAYNPTTNELKLGDTPVVIPENGLKVNIHNTDSALTLWDQAGTVIRAMDGSYPALPGDWTPFRLYVVVDAQGRIAYLCLYIPNGYGGAMSDTYIRHSAYADYTTNPAFLELGEPYQGQWGMTCNWSLGVPEGGFVITAHSDSATALLQLILNDPSIKAEDSFQGQVNSAANNVDNVVVAYNAEGDFITVSIKEEQPAEPIVTVPDFETFNNGKWISTYGSYTSTNGWVLANGAVNAGTDASNDANPQFTCLGDSTKRAVTLNGKVSAPGSLTSPLLEGGLKSIEYDYLHLFTDTIFSLTINVKDADGNVVATTVHAWDSTGKFDIQHFTWVLETPVTGSYSIEIINNCPSQATGNKDRATIFNLQLVG